ncbi:MAG: hypothetical protein V3T31_03150, partial [candidate division Zixibacteria bacterium]
MMITPRNLSLLYLMAIIILSSSNGLSAEGSGEVSAGYVLLDEEGSLALNQETYNSYEGLALSLRQFQYYFDNGIVLRSDLANMTLDNRNLSAAVSRSGQFDLSVRHNQYRRRYNQSGSLETNRKNSAAKIKLQPHRNVSLFGGYETIDREGSEYYQLSPVDSKTGLVDYSQERLNFGGQLRCPSGFARAEYRKIDLSDNTRSDRDRSAESVQITAGSTIPGVDRIFLSGGYSFRKDELTGSDLELTTRQLWGGTRLKLPYRIGLDYRLLFARSKHSDSQVETDNWQNTVALGKVWPHHGSLRIGLESRIIDDLSHRTESNGYF